MSKNFILAVICFSLVCFANQVYADPTRTDRMQMVELQIKNRGITHQATIEAMQRVPRHLYVPLSQRRMAYADRPLPIGFGQTISQPFIVAFMTQIIDPKPHHRVLEIGTGSGYQAAVLAEIVAKVYTIEIIPELGRTAERVLSEHYDNVSVKIADGYYGWEEAGPFDAIVVTAASGAIPPPLIEQLKEGGKMIIPVGSPYMVQQLMLVEKRGGRHITRNLMPVRFVPFRRN
ncbi:MAG TPA: protein-L-isoaspartate(D-aspartate) O-methyltransferase [Bacteroidales bacterium]|nr:protein-L-isoaspartate(D-aspartate) O-methyltransferase [Bacteroidales bacterium]